MTGPAGGQKVRTLLRARLGDEVFNSWFDSLEFDAFDGRVARFTVPVNFLRTWIQSHYVEPLLLCTQAEFKGAERVEVLLRQPGGGVQRPTVAQIEAREARETACETPTVQQVLTSTLPAGLSPRAAQVNGTAPQRTQAGGFEGSPLDPRYTLDSFEVGHANHMAHASARQVAQTPLDDPRAFNPLYIHSSVGLGKTHLLHAIAWEVKARNPDAQVLYLTAERFRYQFVEALRSQDAMAFKERFRQIQMLLIDDLEFMQGEKTELEFDHIINALLDGGRQIVVASARPPSHNERLGERMRSRLQRGLVVEIGAFESDLRRKVLERRVADRQLVDPSFRLMPEVLDLLSERLTENGRELEGAVTRLFATWQYARTPITLDIAETVIRDLVQGLEPRRIKVEDILRVISRHFGVSKGDLLSQRRHRSVVWPRQIGMYLAKQLTSRSLPEIGRRFGNRDHTTVLHAIRKIEAQLAGNPKLREELDDLKKQLSI